MAQFVPTNATTANPGSSTFGGYNISPQQLDQLQFIDMLGTSGIIDPDTTNNMLFKTLVGQSGGFDPYGGMGGGMGLGMTGGAGMGLGTNSPQNLAIEVPDQPTANTPYEGGLPAWMKPIDWAMRAGGAPMNTSEIGSGNVFADPMRQMEQAGGYLPALKQRWASLFGG